jgi:hypothetical protein
MLERLSVKKCSKLKSENQSLVFDEEIPDNTPLQPPSPEAHLTDEESLTDNDDAVAAGDDFVPRPAHAWSMRGGRR